AFVSNTNEDDVESNLDTDESSSDVNVLLMKALQQRSQVYGWKTQTNCCSKC
ncbi:hypothetical protein A2U01_0114920, partial [Trifolium medium]|nr:hypothetical protein [Trifolium medium]